jgi:hypothetical protein
MSFTFAQPHRSDDNVARRQLETALESLSADLKELTDHSKKKSYGAVKAIFLNWADSNLNPNVYDETIVLQTLLREEYRFEAGSAADIFLIPTKYPTEKLQSYISNSISDFCDYETHGKDKLMIVYYNGHGGIQQGTRELLIGGYVTLECMMRMDSRLTAIKKWE